MTDRRKPLGGVLKETYIHGGGHELTYDLLAGIKSDLCHEIKLIQADTAAIKDQCQCRMKNCQNEFVSRKQVFIATGILIAFLIGAGIIGWHEIKAIISVLALEM